MIDVLIENFVPILATILGAVILNFARILAKKYGTKLDLETKARLDGLVSELTQQGVAYAEQWAKNRQKNMPQGAKVAGDDKLRKAAEYVADQVRKYKLDVLAEQEITAKIEAMLGYGTLNENALPDVTPVEEDDDDDAEAWKSN